MTLGISVDIYTFDWGVINKAVLSDDITKYNDNTDDVGDSKCVVIGICEKSLSILVLEDKTILYNIFFHRIVCILVFKSNSGNFNGKHTHTQLWMMQQYLPGRSIPKTSYLFFCNL